MLKVQQLAVSYQGIRGLDAVSFSILAGELVGVVRFGLGSVTMIPQNGFVMGIDVFLGMAQFVSEDAIAVDDQQTIVARHAGEIISEITLAIVTK
jgi:ABC-type uncharacterized transport system ATPase subunit